MIHVKENNKSNILAYRFDFFVMYLKKNQISKKVER